MMLTGLTLRKYQAVIYGQLQFNSTINLKTVIGRHLASLECCLQYVALKVIDPVMKKNCNVDIDCIVL